MEGDGADTALSKDTGCLLSVNCKPKGAVAQLLQPSLAFCFSLQPMTAYRPGLARVSTVEVIRKLMMQYRQNVSYILFCSFMLNFVNTLK